LKVEGEELTGKAYFERMSQKGEAELLEGKVKGDEIFFVEKVNVQGNELRIEYRGKVSGDEISLPAKSVISLPFNLSQSGLRVKRRQTAF